MRGTALSLCGCLRKNSGLLHAGQAFYHLSQPKASPWPCAGDTVSSPHAGVISNKAMYSETLNSHPWTLPFVSQPYWLRSGRQGRGGGTDTRQGSLPSSVLRTVALTEQSLS